MEEEFVQNQERLKPQDNKGDEDHSKVECGWSTIVVCALAQLLVTLSETAAVNAIASRTCFS